MKIKPRKTALSILKTSISYVIAISIGIFVLLKLDIFIEILNDLELHVFILLIFLWCSLTLASPHYTLFFLSDEAKLQLNSFYYDIAITRNLAKYIPGGFWNIIAKAAALKERDVEQKKIKSILIYETFSPLVASIATGITLFLLALSKNSTPALLTIVFAYLSLLFVFFYKNKSLKKTKKQTINYIFGTTTLCSYWVFASGVFFIYFLSTSQETEAINPSLVGACYTLSWATGYITPIAPQGLGVTETSFSLIYNAEFSERLALQLIGFRIIVLCGDLTAFALWTLTKFWKRQ